MTSELNDLTFHYFAPIRGKNTVGRGEHVRLLLEDAGIPYTFVKYRFDETWPEHKAHLQQEGFHTATLPYIQLPNGKRYGNVLPLLRFLSTKLGSYQGSNEDQQVLIDSYADKLYDWYNHWLYATFADWKGQYTTYAPKAYQTWEEILKKSGGPFLLGKEISYADFVLYHTVEDDDGVIVSVQKYPHLQQFMKDVESRSNIQKYFAAGR